MRRTGAVPYLRTAADGFAFAAPDGKNAWRIFRRDRRNHLSPNSAQTESAAAGALGIQPAKPFISRVVESPPSRCGSFGRTRDIRRTNGICLRRLVCRFDGLLRFAACAVSMRSVLMPRHGGDIAFKSRNRC
ncbi:MAG: cobalamin biosynthesis protein [Ruminococcus sp.]